ncbi:NiFe-hydrogenase III small subunit [Methanonatronarchaeum thermophilum]|uniref:NiFe-hydrogenase III small subunit n=1 Tax=Methanonatronarchaeum thermophilum TaxID=1927129 RepID=A0A1Y3GBE9_9EURY|nr:NADH-quinone oxidoreductase subunit B family protein [Methanonatronarchaeum thermophilum]OUJ18560.1 NiFe-hydrogenase III small subunit [Methanonatronarchaeum thermophilum]
MKLSKSFDKSLWVFHFNAGSCNGCDIEILAALTPRYDVERFGIKLVETPRHADVLLVTGPVTKQTKKPLERIYEQMMDPKAVLVIGNCGNTGHIFHDSYNIAGPVDEVIPVDVHIPGCAVRPEGVIFGVVKAWEALEKMRGAGTKEETKEEAEEAA